MHSIGVGIVVQKRCAARPVRLRSAIEERAVLGVLGGVGRHEGAIRDYPFSSPRDASKTPCVSPDPYPWPDSSGGTFVWSRATLLFRGRLRARRRAGPLRSGTIARELHAEPTRPAGSTLVALERQSKLKGGAPRFIRAGLHLPAVSVPSLCVQPSRSAPYFAGVVWRWKTAFLRPPRALLCLAAGSGSSLAFVRRAFPTALPRTSRPPPRSQQGEPSAPRRRRPARGR
jgi:hypothetical protein